MLHIVKLDQELRLFIAKSSEIAAISMGILMIHIDDKDARCGRFFQHFWVHQAFQIVGRDVPPDIGRRMGGVSLLFAPMKLCSPPTISRLHDFFWLNTRYLVIISFHIPKHLKPH